MKKCKTKKYDNGGTLDSVLPIIPAALGMVNPLLGTASGVALNMYQNSKQESPVNNTVVNSNPYGYELGGKLIGNEGAMQYSGASHSEGGIKVNPEGIPVQMSNQEVEGDEVVVKIKNKPYIFSNKLFVK